jgi:hypothetical protein
MSYTHTLGALTVRSDVKLPPCAPADVIADAKAACAVASSVRGFGALQLNLPVSHPYSNDPAWAQFPPCDVQRLPVCPKISATSLTYTPTVTIATYTPPKVPVVITQIKVPATVSPPTLTAVPIPNAPPVTVKVSGTMATYIPPTAPRAPSLQAAAKMVKMGVPSVLVQMPDKTVVAVEDPAAVDAGMSSAAKAGILALVVLGAYGVYRYSKKG